MKSGGKQHSLRRGQHGARPTDENDLGPFEEFWEASVAAEQKDQIPEIMKGLVCHREFCDYTEDSWDLLMVLIWIMCHDSTYV